MFPLLWEFFIVQLKVVHAKACWVTKAKIVFLRPSHKTVSFKSALPKQTLEVEIEKGLFVQKIDFGPA